MTNSRANNSERTALKGLLALLEAAEALARDSATNQADAAMLPQLCRALRLQARQEALHAAICTAIRSAIDTSRRRIYPGETSLQRYARQITADLAVRDLPRSLVGLQIVFEGIGELLAKRLRPARISDNPLFERAFKALARQEADHRRIGEQALVWSLAHGHTSVERLHSAAQEYLHLADELFADCAELFVLAHANPAQYSSMLRTQLPAWLEQGAP